jgi:hypothetical protein
MGLKRPKREGARIDQNDPGTVTEIQFPAQEK